MSDEARLRDIGVMANRLIEGNVMLTFDFYEYRQQWHAVLTGNDSYVGGVKEMHAYLSGASAVMDMYEYRSV